MNNTAVIILAGGKSRRMGRSKALLHFGAEPLLQRMVRQLAPVGSPIIVVAAKGQQLPALPTNAAVVFDEHPDRGPLEGLRVGLQAAASQASFAFVAGCDLPFLTEKTAALLREELTGDMEIAAPVCGEELYPLPAIYHTGLSVRIDSLIADNKRSLKSLLEASNTVHVSTANDDLGELHNVNTPEQLAAALSRIDQ